MCRVVVANRGSVPGVGNNNVVEGGIGAPEPGESELENHLGPWGVDRRGGGEGIVADEVRDLESFARTSARSRLIAGSLTERLWGAAGELVSRQATGPTNGYVSSLHLSASLQLKPHPSLSSSHTRT